MYTNIPNAEGISAVKAAYESYPEKSVAAKIIITFLALILALNNFMFNCKNYLQIRGCAMGTYIYGKIWTEKYLPLIKGKVDLYLRYIDDIFLIWKGTEEELKNLFNEINKKHRSIKFSQKYSRSKIEFLDVLVYKDEQQKLQKTLFKKNKTDSLIFMQNPTTQCQSRKTIPYRQILRVKKSIQQVANSSAIVNYCKSNLQNQVMTHFRLKRKLRR